MTAANSAIPMLRLVNSAAATDAQALPENDTGPQQAAWRVATENLAASRISALDSRWIFAVQVSRHLTGGRAAALSPERRAALLSTARNLGLRAFDASLIIAVVQESTRSGEGLSREFEERLAVIPSRNEGASTVGPGSLLLAFLLGMVGFAALVAWLGV